MKFKNLEQLFQDAKYSKDSKLKQKFINILVNKKNILKEEEKYIKKVKYFPQEKSIIMKDILYTENGFFNFVYVYSIIEIYPLAFSDNYHPVLEDFIGTLKHHEGFHAKDFYETFIDCFQKKIPFPNARIEKIKREIRAYENQIKNFNEKNSYVYIDMVNKGHENYNTPNNYYNKLSESLKKLAETESEIKKLNELLDKLKKINKFC